MNDKSKKKKKKIVQIKRNYGIYLIVKFVIIKNPLSVYTVLVVTEKIVIDVVLI